MRTGTTTHAGHIRCPAPIDGVDEVRVSTVVYAPREEVFEFLMDLRGYPRYTKYLKSVTREGDGGPGTRYTMKFGWWRLTYRAVSEVTDVAELDRIDWRVVKDIDARGHWQLSDASEAASSDATGDAPSDREGAPHDREDSPSDREDAVRVVLHIEYEPDSASAGAIDLPAFISLDRVIDRAVPLIQDEAERVLRRIVADLEGEPRDVELQIHEGPDAI